MSVPRLRFPGFVGEWEEKPLSSAWRVKGKRNYDNAFGKEQVLSVSGDKGVVNQIEHLGRSYAGVLVDNYHVVEKGDIVYTKSPLKANPFGIIKANKGAAGIVSTLYAVYEVNDENDPEFWDRYFELDDRTNGYLMPLVHIGAKNDMKINNERVLIDPVFVPSLPEQKKIAAFLGAVDAKIAALRARVLGLETYKRGLMQALFSQRLRFSKPDGTAFPDWEEKRLGEVAKVNPKSPNLPDVFRYIDLESVNNGVLGEVSEVEKDDAPSRAQRLLQVGDILYQTVRPYQRNNLFFDLSGAFVASTGYAQIRAKENRAFLFQALHTDVFVNRVLERCTGTSYPAINSNDLTTISIPIPHPDEQAKIAEALCAMDAKIAAVQAQVDKMQAFKKGLLQQMFV